MLGAEDDITFGACSGFYETAPVGMISDTLFLNAVAEFFVGCDPERLLELCMSVEKQLGRDRSKGMDRTIDLDILAMDDVIIQTDRLVLPHPRCLERRFVLEPWAEISPEFYLPGTPFTVKMALSSLP